MSEHYSTNEASSATIVDLKRTEHPPNEIDHFYWSGDTIVLAGVGRIDMSAALTKLDSQSRIQFKLSAISFSKQGNYAKITYQGLFSILRTSLEQNTTPPFSMQWISAALNRKTFRSAKKIIADFFLHIRRLSPKLITYDCIRFLNDSAASPAAPRNVLSDDPEVSWLTEMEYDALLSTIWNDYDKGKCGTQVTLIRLLSMQYARRPIQLANLKCCDIRVSDGSDSGGLAGRIIDFPGAKDTDAEFNFRDSKFEPHPLADHLWDLCQIQLSEVKNLYDCFFNLTLTTEQLKKLPFFNCFSRLQEAQKTISEHYKLDPIRNLDHEVFHLRSRRLVNVIALRYNTPTCIFDPKSSVRILTPTPPISHRTGDELVVSSARLRHTRARQLARKGVPPHQLSHWLGHTTGTALRSYYNDPAETARKIDEAMAPALAPLAMAFMGSLIDSEDHATRADDPASKLEFANEGKLKDVGRCGKFSFCATTSVPIPCYRCKYFEPLVNAPHEEVLTALLARQTAEESALKIGGQRNLLIPIDLSDDISAVRNCISRCNARKAELRSTK
ncbi:TPA: site-specific integrase [Pseudomonas aeruginosa]|nr:site-specific integrase [Pseudomonas aeruginosa]